MKHNDSLVRGDHRVRPDVESLRPDFSSGAALKAIRLEGDDQVKQIWMQAAVEGLDKAEPVMMVGDLILLGVTLGGSVAEIAARKAAMKALQEGAKEALKMAAEKEARALAVKTVAKTFRTGAQVTMGALKVGKVGMRVNDQGIATLTDPENLLQNAGDAMMIVGLAAHGAGPFKKLLGLASKAKTEGELVNAVNEARRGAGTYSRQIEAFAQAFQKSAAVQKGLKLAGTLWKAGFATIIELSPQICCRNSQHLDSFFRLNCNSQALYPKFHPHRARGIPAKTGDKCLNFED